MEFKTNLRKENVQEITIVLFKGTNPNKQDVEVINYTLEGRLLGYQNKEQDGRNSFLTLYLTERFFNGTLVKNENVKLKYYTDLAEILSIIENYTSDNIKLGELNRIEVSLKDSEYYEIENQYLGIVDISV